MPKLIIATSIALIAKLEKKPSQHAREWHWCSEFRVVTQSSFITNPECIFEGSPLDAEAIQFSRTATNC
jgi:hypothetical protein